MESLSTFLSLCQTPVTRGDEEVVFNQAKKIAYTLGLNLGAIQQLMVDGRHPLIEACRAGNFKIVEMFVKNGARLNFLDCEGRSPLYAAIVGRRCSLQAIKQLLWWGADVNLQRDGKLPLLASFYSTGTEVSRLLISEGADVNNVVLTCFCFIESVFALNTSLVIVSSGVRLRQDSIRGMVALALDIVLAGLIPKTFYLSGGRRGVRGDGEHYQMEEEGLTSTELAMVWRLQHLCLCLGFRVDRTCLEGAVAELREQIELEQIPVPTDPELIAMADQNMGPKGVASSGAHLQLSKNPELRNFLLRNGLALREADHFSEEIEVYLQQTTFMRREAGNSNRESVREPFRSTVLRNKLSQLLWIQQFQSSPMPLTYLTRLAIRAHLTSPTVSRGTHVEDSIEKLPLPKVFKDFLAPKGYRVNVNAFSR
ncbi:ankyrin repeat domain-containing protein 50 [Plakobranchus ocellatus]|uniref:Ankyrin repeat domain-containing protein 50 n=1 Tax=Plakobranchus ocellatus TaxID=259542 RepID=A0AAV3ZZ25_9GAST|nr:ankyrin repeat domain-containing protein 50 [Plakobranchus ocellatus]